MKFTEQYNKIMNESASLETLKKLQKLGQLVGGYLSISHKKFETEFSKEEQEELKKIQVSSIGGYVHFNQKYFKY